MTNGVAGRKSFLAMAATIAALLLFGLTAAVAAPGDKEKFRLCHATGSVNNPFTELKVSATSEHGDIVNGQLANGPGHDTDFLLPDGDECDDVPDDGDGDDGGDDDGSEDGGDGSGGGEQYPS